MNVRQNIKHLRMLALRLNERTVAATITQMEQHIAAIRAELAPDERAASAIGRDRKQRAGITRAEG